MKTLELNIDQSKTPKELIELLKEKGLSKGDELIIRSAHELNSFLAISVLTMIAIALSVVFRSSKKAAGSSENINENILSRLLKETTPKGLEAGIEKEYGINVELAEPASKKYDPIEEGFGILQDEDVSLEKIRKKAWHRKK